MTFKRPRGAMDNASVWRARGPEIDSHNGQEIFILKFSFHSHAAQRDNSIANEINRGIHLANTLFSLGNSMYLLVHLSFKVPVGSKLEKVPNAEGCSRSIVRKK